MTEAQTVTATPTLTPVPDPAPAAATPAIPAPTAAELVANQEALKASIQANFDDTVDVKTFKFSFREDKEAGKKRPAVTLEAPVPSVEGIIAILQKGGAGLLLLQEAVADVVATRLRELVNENEAFSQATFDLSQVSWETIANLPKAERRGGGIQKEVWEAFAEDYIKKMPAITGKSIDQVTNATKLYLNKFQTIKMVKSMLVALKEQLGIYATGVDTAEQYQECVTFLVEKADKFINMDEQSLLSNI